MIIRVELSVLSLSLSFWFPIVLYSHIYFVFFLGGIWVLLLLLARPAFALTATAVECD